MLITQELASKLPPSKPRNGGPVSCVYRILVFCFRAVWLGGNLFANGISTHLANYVIDVVMAMCDEQLA